MSKLEEIKVKLKQAGLRVTQQRIDIAKVFIQNKGKLLTPEEIYLKIKKSKVMRADQASVYRILAKFEQLKLISKNTFQGEPARFVLDDFREDNDHHHYFKCKTCGKLEFLGGCLLVPKEKELIENGYTQLEHHLEITGLCPGCTKPARSLRAQA